MPSGNGTAEGAHRAVSLESSPFPLSGSYEIAEYRVWRAAAACPSSCLPFLLTAPVFVNSSTASDDITTRSFVKCATPRNGRTGVRPPRTRMPSDRYFILRSRITCSSGRPPVNGSTTGGNRFLRSSSGKCYGAGRATVRTEHYGSEPKPGILR